VPLVLVLGLLSFVGASAALGFSGLPDVTFNEDATGTLNLNTYVSGANGSVTFTYSGNTDVKVSINNGVATFSANANVNDPGETITFTATDQTPTQVADNIIVKINAVNDAPTITLADTVKLKVDAPYSAAVTVTDVDDNTFTFTKSTDWETFVINSVNGQMTFTPTEDDFGPHTVTITVEDNGGGTLTKLTATKDVTFLVTEDTDDGSLTVKSLSIDDKTGADDETMPGDVLGIEFDLSNKITKDMSNINVEAWLQDSTGDRLGDKFELDEEYDVDSKDSQNIKFEMQVSPEALSKTYDLVIWAEGEDEDGNTKSVLATDEVQVKRDSHDVFIEAVAVTPTPVTCGSGVEFTIHVWNIGKTDEDDVHVTVKNSDLKISSDSGKYALDSEDDANMVANAVILDTSKAGTYPIEFTVLFDGDKYSEKLTALLQVTCGGVVSVEPVGETVIPEGTGTLALSQTSVTADIGDKIKFTAILSNTESTNVNYKLTVLGAADWADTNIEPADVTLAPGTSIPVYIYLTPNAGTYGKQEATLSITSGTAIVATKTMTVNLPEKPTTTITPGTGVANPLTAKIGNITLDTNALVVIAFVLAIAMFGTGLALRFRAAKTDKKR
jgi:hypothetical protein